MPKKLNLYFTEKNMHLSKNVERDATHGGVSIFQNLLTRLEDKMFQKKKKNQSNGKFKFIKASESKEVAMKGGSLVDTVFPAGLSAATATLALAAARHAVKKKYGKKRS
jgi:hypothetical protein